MTRSSDGGILDLSALGPADQKVKLPDGKLYSMTNATEMGVLDQQRLMSRYARGRKLMAKKNPNESDVEEALSQILDVCQTIVPDADRALLGRLRMIPMPGDPAGADGEPLSPLMRLVETFSQASPAAEEGEAAPPAARAKKRTSAT